MTKRLKLVLCIVLILLPGLSRAGDFGIVLDQNAGFQFPGDYSAADYVVSLIPRFSAFLGDKGSVFVSAGFSADYEHEAWAFYPELLQTEFTWVSDRWDITAGRMYYSDPLGLISEGLFDGARFSYDMNWGALSAGAWYTGFLYKERANITMNDGELALFKTGLDYGNFAETYFAPKRMFIALDWEHPALADRLLAQASLLGQFDLTGEKLHSQYLIAKLSLPVGAFLFDLGGSLAFLQNAKDAFNIAWAGELQAAWILPASFASRLSLLGRYSSGTAEQGSVAAFLPLTTQYQGAIIKAKLSGIAMISLDYLALLHRTLAMNLSSSYFLRTDLDAHKTYPVMPVPSGETPSGHALGNEFFARFIWSPVSDIQVNLGAGLFLPALGNAEPKAGTVWRIELGLVLSLY